MADDATEGRPRTGTRRVSEVLHDRLRGEILAGTVAPGDPMPSERTLAASHGVNRHAVREALKRLEQAGLVRISQGGATRVQDWREQGGLDLLLDLVRAPEGSDAAGPPVDVVRSVLELRALIGVDAARRFVAGADPAERERVADLVDAVTAAVVAGSAAASPDTAPDTAADIGLVVAAYEDLWRALVAGAGNVAYRLMLNSLNVAVGAFPALAAELAPDDPRALRELAAAVRAGDVERTERLVAEQLQGDVPEA